MSSFRESYKKYHSTEYQEEWNGDILDKNFLMSLKKGLEEIYDISGKFNPQNPKMGNQDELTKELVTFLLGEFLEGDEFKQEFIESKN